MAETSAIGWCDSTLNLEMGCSGCELWDPKNNVLLCYAGVMTTRKLARGPIKGWPARFDIPTVFPERITQLKKWPDLTGTPRPDKPWLDGRPRMVFLNDMGDTFSNGLPLDWLDPFMPVFEASPHIILLLTKRADLMQRYFNARPVPKNVWPGVTVTSAKTAARLDYLERIDSPRRWVSYGPALGPVDFHTYPWLSWLIIEGESGDRSRSLNYSWVKRAMDVADEHDFPVFMKQTGSNIVDDLTEPPQFRRLFPDKGVDWRGWPEWMRRREAPKVV